MANDSKNVVSSFSAVTKEVESRQKLSPERPFEVFLEIREPQNSEAEIIRKYPEDFTDEVLKTALNFAYPCKTPSDEQSEHFTFAILDPTGTLFRYGYCRRSNREATCLCLLSYYPWFEIFYGILNDLFVLINGKSSTDVERYLFLLYNYKLMSNDEFFRHEGKEIIEISGLPKIYTYNRPDPRKLPSMLSSLNFTVMCTRLGPDILLHLFSHILFERRILFVSSKLFHLTACVYGCLQLIHPMHWQSIFLPILPASMSWTTQCTAPYLIGIHSSSFSMLNLDELGDVIIVNIDERRLESQHDDLSCFPKYLLRNLKKSIDHSSRLAGDHLARVFLRTMAFSIGNYASGFLLKNEKLDFDRDLYLEQFRDTHVQSYMSAVANTQMFEQFSRYRTFAQLQRETDVDEFDLEVKQIQDIRKSKKGNKKLYKFLEKAANPLLEQVQTKAGKLQTVINKAGQRVASEASSVMPDRMKRSHSTPKNIQSIRIEPIAVPPSISNEMLPAKKDESSSESSRASTPLIDLEPDENPLLPSPIVLNVIHSPLPSPTPRPVPQIDAKIKQLQEELQYKVQTFDGKRLNPRDEYGQQHSEIKRLVKQFDPLNDDQEPPSNRPLMNSYTKKDTELFAPRQRPNPIGVTLGRHPSIYERIPNNHVTTVLQNIQTNYGTSHRPTPKFEQATPSITDPTFSFDPLARSNESNLKTDESNLIDLD